MNEDDGDPGTIIIKIGTTLNRGHITLFYLSISRLKDKITQSIPDENI